MTNRTWIKIGIALPLLLLPAFLLACDGDDDADHDRLSRADVEQIVQAAIADIPAPAAAAAPAPAAAPRKSAPAEYTKFVVDSAISMYESAGLDATLAYYNTPESVDGQWYVFIIGEDGVTIAHHNPGLRGRDPSLRVDPTGYFYGDALLAATESGRWVDYVIANPASGQDRQKHTWAVLHDGLIFASGWYED